MEAPASRRYIGEVVLRRYIIEQLVGEGSFALVYRARSRDGEVVAVKVLHSDQPTASVRFIREIRVLQALPPNLYVAGYIDHGTSLDGNPLLVLEYVDGITLKLGLERRPHLSPAKAVAFVAQLCQAFVGLHQLGVAHRDVKPENILMARDGSIKLIDFGLIRDAQGILKLLEEGDPLSGHVFAEDLDRGVIAGTPEYMAPEQFSDSALDDVAQTRTDTSSDVFSLGVILFELLTGHKPFPMREVARKQYPSELLRYLRWRIRLRDRDLPPLPGLESALQSIVRKALRRNPRRRQPDATALMDDLLRFQRTGQGVIESDDSRTAVASIRHGSIFNLATAATEARRIDAEPISSTFFFEEDTTASRGHATPFAEPAGRGHSAPFFDAGAGEPTDPASASFDPLPRSAEVQAIERPVDNWRGENLAELSREDSEGFWQTENLDGLDQLAEARAWDDMACEPELEERATPIGIDLDGVVSGSAAGGGVLDEPPRSAEPEPFESHLDGLEAVSTPLRHELDQDLGGAGSYSRAQGWPVENLADPPREDEPQVLSAPTDAPSLASGDVFDDIDDVAADLGRESPEDEMTIEQVNLADLAPRVYRSHR
jgi:serine/threonine protein kinase